MKSIAVVVIASAAVSGLALAQSEPAVLELTIKLMPADAELPAAVTATIDLPVKNAGEAARHVPSTQGLERSERGVETANRAREDGRAFGEAAAAAARDNRESAARATRPEPGPRTEQVPTEPPSGPPSTR